MARKKKLEEGKEPEVRSEESITFPSDPSKISNEQEAIDLVRMKYKIPDHIKTVYVTEDKQVFYRNNTSQLHADQNKLKRFIIRWD